MSNSIDLNLGKENNSMLSFHWVAIFKDGIKIAQFDEKGVEHRFQEVKDRFNDLILFYLISKNQQFVVNLVSGTIDNYDTVPPLHDSKEIKKNIRLIFFRRHKVTMGDNGKKQNHTITYHLGFQYNYEDGKNRQTILKIDEEGNFTIE